MLGWKADDFFVAVKTHLDSLDLDLLNEACKSFQHMTEVATQKLSLIDVNLSHQALKSVQRTSNLAAGKLIQLNTNHFDDVLTAVHQMVDNITLATWTIPNAFAVSMYILLFTGLVIILAACMLRIMRNLDKRANKVSASVQTLSTEITSLVNLGHQHLFAEAVYNWILLKYLQQCMHPAEYPVEAKPNETQYIVFHPSSDWHPSLFAYGTEGWSDEFMDEEKETHILRRTHLFNSPQKLATYLDDYANSQVTGDNQFLPLTYILLPSTNAYTLPFTLHVPQQFQYVRVVGQTDRNGKPYCGACIIGVDPSNVVDVDLLAEHKAPDYTPPSESAFDKRLYPLLGLVIALLWFGEQLSHLFDFLGGVACDWCGCLLWPYRVFIVHRSSLRVSSIGIKGTIKGRVDLERQLLFCRIANSYTISSSDELWETINRNTQ